MPCEGERGAKPDRRLREERAKNWPFGEGARARFADPPARDTLRRAMTRPLLDLRGTTGLALRATF